MANSDGTEAVRLTDGANDGWPTWSPDGTKIAFSSTRHDPNVGACTSTGDTDLGCPTDIYVMDADGSNVTRLTTSSGSEYQPVWSPDGTRIAFTHTLETWSPTAVYVMNADGTDAYPIASYTWILLYQSPTDKDKGRKMVAFMRWAITDGEAFAKDLGYAPLPDAVVKLEQDTLGKIQVQ